MFHAEEAKIKIAKLAKFLIIQVIQSFCRNFSLSVSPEVGIANSYDEGFSTATNGFLAVCRIFRITKSKLLLKEC